ncbi:B12-binding domain-containing radical SAM protein [bacterium]|nr:B12-binding domain-containing radical SAM protein [bacterium]
MARALKILLLGPPWGEVYGNFRSITRSLNLNPPLNLAYLAGTLARDGHDVLLHDLEFAPRRLAHLHSHVDAYAPDIAGITITSPMVPVIRRISAALRRLGVPLVAGGPHVTLVGRDIFRDLPDVDYAFTGEAEESFARFALAWGSGERAARIEGLMLRDRDEPSGAPPLVADLDALPEPHYPGIDFQNYPWSVKGRRRVPTRTMLTSRGCPFQCVFCAIENLTGRRVRYRSIDRVVAEMERAVRETPARHFVFVDDFLTLRRERIMELSEKLAAKKLPLTWEGDTRADSVDEELLRAMARAGCTRVNFGIESGDVQVLKTIKKKLTLSRVVEATRWAKAAGMDTRGTAMIGNPGDTRATIDKTIRFLRDLPHLDQPYLSIAQPYPGTELRRMALAGESNLRIVGGGLDDMRRYGSSVMQVGDIGPAQMVRLQRRAIFRMYATPRRVFYNLFRADPRDTIGMALALLLAVARPVRRQPAVSAPFAV